MNQHEIQLVKMINKLIESEIDWCAENPDEILSEDYQMGFVGGLLQAKYILNQLAKVETSELPNKHDFTTTEAEFIYR